MQSVILSNPIYQHSGESEKNFALAQQASVNEDQEQRRRQLDSNGERKKIVVAREVAHMVDEFGGSVHLKATPFEEPKGTILTQATAAATGVVNSTLTTGLGLLHSAQAAVSGAVGAVTNTAKGVVDTASHIAHDAASTATHLVQDAATTAQNTATVAKDAALNAAATATTVAKNTAATATHLAQDAASTATTVAKNTAATATHLAQDAAATATSVAKNTAATASSAINSAAATATHLAQDAAATATHVAKDAAHQASDLAGAVSQKASELAEVAVSKTRDIADNISHFTTLVGVLAEEENERARRLVSGDEARSAANAFRISGLIRELGPEFYKQQPNLNYATKVLEEAERRWRLNSAHSSQAESNAHNLGKVVNNNLKSFMPRYEWVRLHISGIEEKERTRRMNDSNEIYAISNALNTSVLIKELGEGYYRQEGSFNRAHSSYATTLLEENERRNRIRTDRIIHADDSAHLLMDVVATNIEKFNYSTRNASKVANEFANMLANATIRAANTFQSASKDLAKITAERVRVMASDLSNYTNILYLAALEEKERARRLSDPDEISAINNAWAQSGLIRDLSALYKPASVSRYPLNIFEEQERRWRLSHLQGSSSRKLAAIVNANIVKFEAGAARSAAHWHAKDTVSHSRLNPNAPAFVPHQALPAKAEPVPIIASYAAAGAQL